MTDTIHEATNIMSNYDWYWSMADSGYKQNRLRAEKKKNAFLNVLKKIDDKEVVQALRSTWVINTELAMPYMDNTYYEEKKALLAEANEHLDTLIK